MKHPRFIENSTGASLCSSSSSSSSKTVNRRPRTAESIPNGEQRLLHGKEDSVGKLRRLPKSGDHVVFVRAVEMQDSLRDNQLVLLVGRELQDARGAIGAEIVDVVLSVLRHVDHIVARHRLGKLPHERAGWNVSQALAPDQVEVQVVAHPFVRTGRFFWSPHTSFQDEITGLEHAVRSDRDKTHERDDGLHRRHVAFF